MASTQLPIPAAAQIIPGSADATGLDFEKQRHASPKSTPVLAAPSGAAISDARLLTVAELEQFLAPSVTLKSGITKVHVGSGVAFTWRTGSLSGEAEQQKLRDPSGFDEMVAEYLISSMERCDRAFAAKAGLKKENGGTVVLTYDLACADKADGMSVSVLFYSQTGLFTFIAHEGSLDDMDAGMEIRDKLAEKSLAVRECICRDPCGLQT